MHQTLYKPKKYDSEGSLCVSSIVLMHIAVYWYPSLSLPYDDLLKWWWIAMLPVCLKFKIPKTLIMKATVVFPSWTWGKTCHCDPLISMSLFTFKCMNKLIGMNLSTISGNSWTVHEGGIVIKGFQLLTWNPDGYVDLRQWQVRTSPLILLYVACILHPTHIVHT